MDIKTRPIYMLSKDTHFRCKDQHTNWKWRDGKDISWKLKPKEQGIATLDKIDFKTKTVIKDKDGHDIMIRSQSSKKIKYL